MKSSCLLAVIAAALVLPSAGQTIKLKVVHDFGSSQDGNHPSGSLFLDSKGNLYGVTGGGPGEYANGIAFELTPQKNGSWQESTVHTFASIDGSPWGAFVADAMGNLYGSTVGGPVSNSEAYELSPGPSGWNFNVVYTDGAGPGLLMDKAGDLYGSIGLGDYFGLGAMGELSPGLSGWTYTQLYSFTCQPSCADGYDPLDPPIWDLKGNLWGTMYEGGIGQPACPSAFGCGVIYVMTPNGDGTWTYHVMHRFASSPNDGQRPVAGLVMDAAGNFYGTTEGGGPHGCGTIFKFGYSNGRWRGTLLYGFPDNFLGCYPEGTLARDGAGNLYGMAQGGANSCGGLSCGVVYRLAPQSNGTWKYVVLVNLGETTGGVLPFYGLTLDGKGHLFGVTSSFGQYGGGTAFEITP
jgi:uncharacterized repeat protein (TIGR03803 family)